MDVHLEQGAASQHDPLAPLVLSLSLPHTHALTFYFSPSTMQSSPSSTCSPFRSLLSTCGSLSRCRQLIKPSRPISSLPPSSQPSQWVSEVLSKLEDLNPKPVPESRLTKLATRISTKLPSCFVSTGPLSRYLSRRAPLTEDRSLQGRLFTGLCDDMQTAVEACQEIGKIKVPCAGMSKYLKNKLAPVNRKRFELDKLELSEMTAQNLATFDMLQPAVATGMFSLVVGSQESDEDAQKTHKICTNHAKRWASLGSRSKSILGH
jgi:hypothetical protein